MLLLLLLELLVKREDSLVGADGAGLEASEEEGLQAGGAAEGDVRLAVLKAPVQVHFEEVHGLPLRLVDADRPRAPQRYLLARRDALVAHVL